jgi:type II secretion system protein C
MPPLALALLLQAQGATLVGVVHSRKPELSVAIVESGGRARVVCVGETFDGARVLEIGAASVVLEAGGQRLELRLRGEVLAADALAARPAPRAGEPGPELAPPAAQPGVKTLSRAEVDVRLRSEIPRILAETTIFPVTDEGRVVGFTLTRIPAGTLLSDVGLQPGDVLSRVNDVPIDNLATLISLWPRLQGAPQLRADVVRGGQPVSLVVNIK